MTRRLLFSYLTITLFVLLILEIPLGIFFRDLNLDNLTAKVTTDAMVLATIYEDALDLGLPYSSQPADDYRASTDARVIVVDVDGISIVDTDAEIDRDFSTRVEIAQALNGDRADGQRFSTSLDTNLFFVAVPVASGGDIHGAVRITLPMVDVEARITRFWWGLAAIGVVVLAAMAGVGWVIATSIARPIREVEEAAARAAGGDLEVRIDPGDAPLELNQLVVTFNTMAERLQDLILRHRSFVADASHQLRTPLTALRLRLENVQASTEDDPDLEAAIDEVARMADLVDQLLLIARGESGQETSIPIDLAEVARDRRDTWSAVADEQDVELTVESPDEAPALAIPGAVEQVLDNYLANALAVSPRGSRVHIQVRDTGIRQELHVIDQGPGLPEEERSKAFDRFWRGDSGRPGTGLGLAIVRQLAELSGGFAELRRAEEGGIDATLTLLTATHSLSEHIRRSTAAGAGSAPV